MEVASARVSKGEMEAVKLITNWCAQKVYLDRIGCLVSLMVLHRWTGSTNQGQSIKSFVQGSVKHVKYQLKKRPKSIYMT